MNSLPSMKRFALGLVLSMMACNQVVTEAPAAAPALRAATFATISALCSADWRDATTCTEDAQALAGTKFFLGSDIREVKAVAVDSEKATDTFLAVRTSAGWSAIHTPILHDEHDDPGCPSIERATRIVSATVDQGMLVVVNEANRYWWNANEAGDLTLTYARACTIGADCAEPAVVYAKLVASALEEPDGPMRTRFFTTTFTIAANGIISPAETYADAKL